MNTIASVAMCIRPLVLSLSVKQLFAKLRVKNISAAIAKVQEYGLL